MQWLFGLNNAGATLHNLGDFTIKRSLLLDVANPKVALSYSGDTTLRMNANRQFGVSSKRLFLLLRGGVVGLAILLLTFMHTQNSLCHFARVCVFVCVCVPLRVGMCVLWRSCAVYSTQRRFPFRSPLQFFVACPPPALWSSEWREL